MLNLAARVTDAERINVKGIHIKHGLKRILKIIYLFMYIQEVKADEDNDNLNLEAIDKAEEDAKIEPGMDR